MTDRDRLIHLIMKAKSPLISLAAAEKIADYLLANGVIVPPCKVGDYIYLVNEIDGSITEFIVHSVLIVCLKDNYKSVRVQFIDEYGYRNFDYQFNGECFGKTVFLTKEEAENALKERVDNG